jgi:hypothetical protein
MGQGRLSHSQPRTSSLDRKNRNSLNVKRLQDLAERGDSNYPHFCNLLILKEHNLKYA